MTPPPEEWAVDSEWGYCDGHVGWESCLEPVTLCLVGLRRGERIHFWGRDPRLVDFFREHGEDLFIAHSATAEMKYLLRLGAPLPGRWFDTMAAWRYVTNP